MPRPLVTTTQPQPTTMPESYEQSVLEAADEFGYLTQRDAKRIIREHNASVLDAWLDLGDGATDAQKLLFWLGY